MLIVSLIFGEGLNLTLFLLVALLLRVNLDDAAQSGFFRRHRQLSLLQTRRIAAAAQDLQHPSGGR